MANRKQLQLGGGHITAGTHVCGNISLGRSSEGSVVKGVLPLTFGLCLTTLCRLSAEAPLLRDRQRRLFDPGYLTCSALS